MKKDVKQFIKRVEAVGIIVKPQANGHWRMVYEGSFVGTLPATPGDGRWRNNVIADMRLFGVDLIQLEKEISKTKKKKDAGGQSPPPLPVIGKVQQMAHVQTIDGYTKDDLIKTAVTLAKQIATHYDLKIRKGRQTGHGMVPRLAEVVYAYHRAVGREVPHLNYSALYDPTDMKEMSRLLAIKVSDIASKHLIGDDPTVTLMTQTQLLYARDAWDWFELNDYTIPVEVDEPTIEAIMADVDEIMPHSEPSVINGHSDDIAVAVRAIFLMGQSHYPDLDEIERIGMRLIDLAIR